MNAAEFDALQQLWYGKAAQAGHRDIERYEDSDIMFHKPVDALHADIGSAYFDSATEFLWGHQWTSRRKRRMWALHCKGHRTAWIGTRFGLRNRTTPRRILQQIREEQAERDLYFKRATRFLLTHAFPTEQQRHAWELHSNRMTSAEVAEMAGYANGDAVRPTLRRLRAIMERNG